MKDPSGVTMLQLRCCLLVLLSVACATAAAGEVIVLPSKAGAVAFPHSQHFGVTGGCVACHHTSQAGGAMPACRSCHGVGSGVRSAYHAFHDSCIGCHERTVQTGQKSGPVKRCGACHQPAR